MDLIMYFFYYASKFERVKGKELSAYITILHDLYFTQVRLILSIAI